MALGESGAANTSRTDAPDATRTYSNVGIVLRNGLMGWRGRALLARRRRGLLLEERQYVAVGLLLALLLLRQGLRRLGCGGCNGHLVVGCRWRGEVRVGVCHGCGCRGCRRKRVAAGGTSASNEEQAAPASTARERMR